MEMLKYFFSSVLYQTSFKEGGSNWLTLWSLREALPSILPDTVGVSEGWLLREFLIKVSGAFRLRTVSLWVCVGLASSSSFSALLWPPVSEELDV